MGRPSPKYTAEFKQRAAGLYRELGCDAGSISDWVRRADASGVFANIVFDTSLSRVSTLRSRPR